MSHIEEDNCTGSNVKEFSALAQFLFIHVCIGLKQEIYSSFGESKFKISLLGNFYEKLLLSSFFHYC